MRLSSEIKLRRFIIETENVLCINANRILQRLRAFRVFIIFPTVRGARVQNIITNFIIRFTLEAYARTCTS